MSKQTFFLLPKILALDRTIQKYGDSFHEAHPELSFATWSGTGPLPAKRTAEGQAARAQLIDARWPGARESAPASLGPKTGRWQTDDLLDAFAMLWTALRIAAGTAVPVGDGTRDALGLPMRITT